MKRLVLKEKPVFPLKLVRPKSVRDEWIAAGLAAFSVSWPQGKSVHIPKAIPFTDTEDYLDMGEGRFRTVLVIDVADTTPLGEVWDKEGICRVWFNDRGGICMEACRINGWNKKPSDLRPVTSDFSDEALEKVLEIFDL